MDFPMFSGLRDLRVLELAPYQGRWTEQLLLSGAQVTVLEADPVCIPVLAVRVPTAEVVCGLWEDQLADMGSFDCVVLFGILTHTANPLGLLETVVNYNQPEIILLEADDGLGVRLLKEATNQTLQRQTDLHHNSGMVIHLGLRAIKDALANMNYLLTEGWGNVYRFERVNPES